MEFLEFINEDLVTMLKSNHKTEAIIEMATLAGTQKLVNNIEDLTEKLFYREQLMSTGLGLGIGIPHVRYNGLKKPGVLVGIHKGGISDYQSIDNIPVKLIFMIILREEDQKLHLRLLSQIVRIFKNPEIAQKLIDSKNSKEAFEFLKISAKQ